MSLVGLTTLFRDHAPRGIKSALKIFIPTRFRPRWIRYYWAIRGLMRWRWSQLCALTMGIRFRRMSVQASRRVKSGTRPHTLPAALIVSVTSYPPRFGTLALTLHSLLRQSVQADRTILWLAHADIRLLPREVSDLQAAGLEIRATEDMRSYKKIIPALDAFPDAFICTADDDIYYWPTWLERLVEEQIVESTKTTEPVVTCYRAHEIELDSQGYFKSYNVWSQDVLKKENSKLLFPTGMGGVIYPPGILTHTASDREAAFTLCPHNDDIWLYWIGRRNGATYKTVGRSREFALWRGSQRESLFHINVELGGNDDQIRKLADRYGYPAGSGMAIPLRQATSNPVGSARTAQYQNPISVE
jgi:hypothetical protein